MDKLKDILDLAQKQVDNIIKDLRKNNKPIEDITDIGYSLESSLRIIKKIKEKDSYVTANIK